MKNIFSMAVAASILFSGCGNSWLEKAQPSTSTDSDKAITSTRDAQYALHGIYDILRGNEYYGARMTYYADVTGEDMMANGDTKRAAKYYLFDFNKDNAPSSLWYQPYRAIRNANRVLEYIESLPQESLSTDLRDIKGQALTLRAMGHFDVVKVYGKPFTQDGGASLGAPIETSKKLPTSKPARNTVKEVYTQVISDLEMASSLLSTARNDGKINKFAADQLLARAYLYAGQDAKALATASKLIEDAAKTATATKAQYLLWGNDEYAGAWAKDFSSEIVFQLYIIKAENGPGKEGIGNLFWRQGYNDIILSGDYMDLINQDPDDVRLKVITKYTDSKKRAFYYSNKYPGSAALGENPEQADIPVLRLSEAYLIAAEAAVKTGDNTAALKYINAIVRRANPAKSVSGTVTLARVMEERRKELVGEGHRLFDAMRNDFRIERKSATHNSPLLTAETKSFDRSFFKTIFAIPRVEIDINPNIVQNDGY